MASTLDCYNTTAVMRKGMIQMRIIFAAVKIK
jgi:hypothetical protein